MKLLGQCLFWWAACAFGAASFGQDFTFFEEKIRPILVKHCYECHGAGAEKIKGGLWLDSREGLLRGGDTGPGLVPGDPDHSKIVIAVRHNDPDLQMPPKTKLSDDQISAIEQWVKMGAPDPRTEPGRSYGPSKELWSVKPLQASAPPKTKGGGGDVDSFLLAKLEEKGLRRAPAADRRTLLRRASFDLTGLPPTPAEIEAFLADKSEGAFAAAIDRLLSSVHFGERWGRHWLDVARYADSNGLQQNLPFANAWRYRDYVLAAFNQDKPYHEFIREQLAGDLLPYKDNEERHAQWIATGFLMIGPKNFAEPNREKLLMDVADEQIDVTSRAFLGLTVSCARCHDHKFDPIPTRDYYALAGIFRSTQTLGGENRGPFPGGNGLSERPLGTPEEAAAVEAYQKKLTQAESGLQQARRLSQELPGGIDSKELDGIVLDNAQAEIVGGWALSNYSTNFVDKNYLHDGNEVKAKGKKLVRFSPDIPLEGLYEIRLAYTARPNRATNVPVRVKGKTGEKTVYLNQRVEPSRDKAFEPLGVFELEKGTNNLIEVLTQGTKGFVVVDAVQLLPQDVQLAASLTKKRPVADENNMMMAGVTAAQREEYEYKVLELRSQAPPPLPAALAPRDGEPRNVKIHIRGDPERLGDEVPRGFLSVVEHVQTGALATDSSGRLDLANWIAHDQNPLTARVMVNRIWLHLFGRGLVDTPDNFGSMGEPPTHPELLDFLAAEFIRDGWSTKKMIRRLMLTQAYQLSSGHDAKAHAMDPENRYLWRMHRKRLDAESLRDSMLAVNGSLDRTVGGDTANLVNTGPAPFANPEPRDLTTFTRRSLYLPIFRGNLNDLFQVFDFPDPHALSGKRYITTAPTQALFLMNSPLLTEQARLWTDSLLKNGQSDAELAEHVYLAAYARTCSSEEKARALAFLKNFGDSLAASEPDAAARRHKALQAFCQAILQSTEFRFLN